MHGLERCDPASGEPHQRNALRVDKTVFRQEFQSAVGVIDAIDRVEAITGLLYASRAEAVDKEDDVTPGRQPFGPGFPYTWEQTRASVENDDSRERPLTRRSRQIPVQWRAGNIIQDFAAFSRNALLKRRRRDSRAFELHRQVGACQRNIGMARNAKADQPDSLLEHSRQFPRHGSVSVTWPQRAPTSQTYQALSGTLCLAFRRRHIGRRICCARSGSTTLR